MTTVAFDGKTLAADKQSTYGTTPVPTNKIHKVKFRGKPAYAACAGVLQDFMPIIEWLKNPKLDKPEPNEKADFSIMVIGKDGEVFYAGNALYFHEMGKVKWALGTGADYALGAMYAGKSAVEAIEIAGKLDVNTGLGVDAVEPWRL